MFGRGEEAELSASSPVPVPGCRVEGVAPQVMQYLVLGRDYWKSSSLRFFVYIYFLVLKCFLFLHMLAKERHSSLYLSIYS